MILNTNDYVSLMRDRADGSLPSMGSAIRLAELLSEDISSSGGRTEHVSLLDVGCATGHYLRAFREKEIPLNKYCGIEIDPAMVSVANDIWRNEIDRGEVEIINVDIDQLQMDESFDYVLCMNAFMYFPSAMKTLSKLLSLAKKRVLIRSYFSEANYRIIRPQTQINHDKSSVDEADAFDDDGNIPESDLWNIYSFAYIESLVAKLNCSAKVEWVDDNNRLGSIIEEEHFQLEKRGATQVISGMEVSYPFILPWKYLSITL